MNTHVNIHTYMFFIYTFTCRLRTFFANQKDVGKRRKAREGPQGSRGSSLIALVRALEELDGTGGTPSEGKLRIRILFRFLDPELLCLLVLRDDPKGGPRGQVVRTGATRMFSQALQNVRAVALVTALVIVGGAGGALVVVATIGVVLQGLRLTVVVEALELFLTDLEEPLQGVGSLLALGQRQPQPSR